MGIEEHQKDYIPNAWESYSLGELGMWVHLLKKRAGHRSNEEKKAKDLHDAENYLWMLEQKILNL